MSGHGNPKHAIQRLNLWGLIVVIMLIGGVGTWAATSQLSGAVIAPGQIVVESSVKKVQHPTGGIISALHVHEGAAVHEGDVLLRLDETVARTTVGIVQSQIDELTARRARLEAERHGDADMTFPDQFLARKAEPTVAAAIKDENKLFQSRRVARHGQHAQMNERITQIKEEIRGLAAQQEGTDKEIKFIAEELKGVAHLYRRKLVTIDRYMTLQRAEAGLTGRRGQLISDSARARGKINEIETQKLQIDRDFHAEVLKELREVQGKIAELQERRTAARDQLKRLDIRAPRAGYVHQLAVHTVGGVVGGGETIMLIVPGSDKLVAEARVAPHDIDQLNLGAKVTARIMAGNQRTMTDVSGALIGVSADLTQDPKTNTAYYSVRASLSDWSLEKLGSFKLVPGMPVELFIQTQDRTPLQFLLKPLQEQIAHAFRER